MKNDQRPELCLSFLGWQCRVRQYAVRQQGGRPPRGIQASVKIDGDFAGQINTVMNKLEPANVTAEFRFMVQKTNEPEKVYDNALKYLSEYYYQYPAEFDERLMALFGMDNALGERLVDAGSCELGFFQGNQKYDLICKVSDCAPGSAEYEATYWHNHLFNPHLPGRVRIVRFDVDWERSSAETP